MRSRAASTAAPELPSESASANDEAPTESTGAAWENIALQGTISGLVIHGMSGLDYEKATEELGLPEEFKVEMMFAVGLPGNKDELPDKLREIEKPSGRKELSEIVSEGVFNFK